jgi:ubiquinone biosynthesis protein
LAELIEPYARGAVTRRFSPKRAFRRLKTTVKDWDHLLEILPKDAADILHNMKRGRFDIHLEHRRLETIVNRLVMGILTAAIFIGSASLWSSQVPPLVSHTSLPSIAGCIVATAMGWTIVRQISRSDQP